MTFDGTKSRLRGISYKELLTDIDVLVLSSDSGEFDQPLDSELKDIIICDVTAFGRDESKIFETSEQAVQALSGVAFTTGSRDKEPTISVVPYLEMQTAVYAACAIIAATLARTRTGNQLIDLALYDVSMNAMLTFLPGLFNGTKPERCGNRHPSLVPWNCFRCSDGWINICAPSEPQWARLCHAMHKDELVLDRRFCNAQARLLNVDDIDQIISAWCEVKTVVDVEAILIANSVAAAPVISLNDLPLEPNIIHRGMVAATTDLGSAHASVITRSPVVCWTRADDFACAKEWSDDNDFDAWAAMDPGYDPIARSNGALTGIKVVEVGTNTVAPLAGRQLGALGAWVIKVEPMTGDPSRATAPLSPDGCSYAFALSNTDKSSIALDLNSEDGKRLLRNLLASADVLIENLKPGSLEKLGFGHDLVRKNLPKLIYCSGSGFGIDSVYPSRPAFDSVIQGMAGIMDTLNSSEPTKTGVSTADLLGGQFLLLSCLAGLYFRESRGEGGSVDISMQDCAAWATQEAWNGGRELLSQGVSLAVLDGWILVESTNGRRPHIPNELAHELSRLDRLEAVLCLNINGSLRATPIRSVEEAVRSSMTSRRRMFSNLVSDTGEFWSVLASPLKLSRTPPTVTRVMPILRPIADRRDDEICSR